MYRRSNTNNYTTNLTLESLGLPAGVLIGKKGCTINQLKSRSGAHLSLKNGNVQFRGYHKQVMEAKRLVFELASNFKMGILRLNEVAPKVRKLKVRIETNDGWSSKGRMSPPVPKTEKSVVPKYSGRFADLDSSDDESDPPLQCEPNVSQKHLDRIKEVEAAIAEAKEDLQEAQQNKQSWADAGDIDDLEIRIECLEEKLVRLKRKK